MDKEFEVKAVRPKASYWMQLKAMLKRNILLKKRERRKTCAVSYNNFR